MNGSMLVLAWLLSGAPADPVRVEGNVFVSGPPASVTVTVDPTLGYLGSVPFDIRGIAGGHRYVWGEADDRKHLKRTFIVQVEGYYPDNDASYDYPSPTPVSLAGQPYQHDVWVYDNDASARRHPGSEPDVTKRFLSRLGYAWGPELVMARFARVVDAERRNEILFFYFENLRDYSRRPLAEFPEVPTTDAHGAILRTVDAHARAAFSVTR